MLVLTTAVVVLTLVVQGLSLAGVVNRSGLALEPEHTAREEAAARDALGKAALARIDELAGLETHPAAALGRVRRALVARMESGDGDPLADAYTGLRREVIRVENAELRRLYEVHEISDATRRRLQNDLDREEAGLGEA